MSRLSSLFEHQFPVCLQKHLDLQQWVVQLLSMMLQCTSFASTAEFSKENLQLATKLGQQYYDKSCSVLHNRIGAVHICSQQFTF